jgi:hypothetical protein
VWPRSVQVYAGKGKGYIFGDSGLDHGRTMMRWRDILIELERLFSRWDKKHPIEA